MLPINYNSLCSSRQVGLKPEKEFASDSIDKQFLKKNLVVNFIESFGIVKINNVSIHVILKILENGVNM